jgi:hypothetical protein
MQRRLDAGYTRDEDVPGKGDSGKIPVTWNGIEYGSITECATANGYSNSALRSKLNQGYVCDDDIPEQAAWSRKPRTWNGVEYPSLAEAVRQTGIAHTTLGGWLARGYNCDDDVPPNIKLDFQKAEEIRQLFKDGYSRKQLAEMFNISSPLVSLVVRNKLWVSDDK